MNAWFFLFLALLAGAFLPLQAGINAQLANNAGSAIWAAFASFGVGTIALLLLYGVMSLPWPSLRGLGTAPWWAWTGGTLGAFYVASVIFLVPRLGAAALISLVVAGQMLASLALDHYGLVSYPQHSVSFGRAAGAILLVAGVVLIRRT